MGCVWWDRSSHSLDFINGSVFTHRFLFFKANAKTKQEKDEVASIPKRIGASFSSNTGKEREQLTSRYKRSEAEVQRLRGGVA